MVGWSSRYPINKMITKGRAILKMISMPAKFPFKAATSDIMMNKITYPRKYIDILLQLRFTFIVCFLYSGQTDEFWHHFPSHSHLPSSVKYTQFFPSLPFFWILQKPPPLFLICRMLFPLSYIRFFFFINPPWCLPIQIWSLFSHIFLTITSVVCIKPKNVRSSTRIFCSGI